MNSLYVPADGSYNRKDWERKVATAVNSLTLATGRGIPPGVLSPYAVPEAPAGWLNCNGASVSRIDYPALFDIIGQAFGGVGEAFNLPDLRGRFLLGFSDDEVFAASGGASEVVLEVANLPPHAHPAPGGAFVLSGGAATGSGQPGDATTGTIGLDSISHQATETGEQGDGTPLVVMPPYVAMHWIIKA